MLGGSPIATAVEQRRAIEFLHRAYEQAREDLWNEQVAKLGLPEHLLPLLARPDSQS